MPELVQGRPWILTSSNEMTITSPQKQINRVAVIGAGPAGLTAVKNLLTIGLIWFAFSQIVPLYLGWELIMGRRDFRHRTEVKNVST